MSSHEQLIKKFHLLENKAFSKKLGQNFILDTNLLDRIVDFAGNIEGEKVLEIGSGVGSLSHRILLRRPAHLTIWEKDPRCVEAVRSWLDVDIQECDALDRHFETELPDDLILIANLPYSVATDILVKLCFVQHKIKRMVLMFQKEVADRIVAVPRIKDYGRLSILAQSCFDCQIVKILPPHVFTPAPKVYSALVLFTPKSYVPAHLKRLEVITQQLFSKRRKMIRQSLTPAQISLAGISETARPEEITVEQFQKLSQID